MRPSTNMPQATVAPELPALTTPSAWPSLTSRVATWMEESRLRRRASPGLSSISTTWVAGTTSTSSPSVLRRASSALMRDSSPTRTMRMPSRAASTAAGTTMWGPKSPPMASTAMRGACRLLC